MIHLKTLHTFQEHALRVSGEERDLRYLAECLRIAGAEGTLSDLAYQIEYAFDIDGIRSLDDPEEVLT